MSPGRVVLCGVLLLFATLPVAADEPVPLLEVKRGERLTLERIATALGERYQRPVVVEPGLELQEFPIYVDTALDIPILRQLLRSAEMELVFKDTDSGEVIHLLNRQNLSRIIGNPTVLEAGAPLPEGDRLVTITIALKRANARTVYGAVQGMIYRDPARVGRVSLATDLNGLVLTDLSPQIDYYRRLIGSLDVKPFEADIRVTLCYLPAEAFRELGLPKRLNSEECVTLRQKLLGGEVTGVKSEDALIRVHGTNNAALGDLMVDLEGGRESPMVRIYTRKRPMIKGSTLLEQGVVRMIVCQAPTDQDPQGKLVLVEPGWD